MLRKFHSWSGLIATLLVVLLAMTGAVLSINPLLERSQAKVADAAALSVAELTGTIAARYSGVEQVQRSPSGSIIVYFTDGDQAGADLINPLTGETIGVYSTSPFMVWIKNLHRSYLLDTTGRIGAGIGALLMLLLTLTGAFMLAKRLGGWRYLLRPRQGALAPTPLAQRLHSQAGRLAMLGLLLSATTGLYMSAVTLELLPEYPSTEPAFPDRVNGGEPAAVNTLAALKAIPVSELRELVYPYVEDRFDVYSITTHQGSGFIDQSTGELLAYQPYSRQQQLYELIYQLHTGEGIWWLGLLLGLCALTVPLMAWTGIQIWWHRQQSATTINHNIAAHLADTVILVGSETNSTWGFAKTLHDALTLAGYRVHTGAMNNMRQDYFPQAKRLFILTATYGDGAAPASANYFLARLKPISAIPKIPVAVLGFGDRQFPRFCQFAKEVEAALKVKGWPILLPLDMINRQSSQEFTRWGNTVSKVLNTELTLTHTPTRPSSTRLALIERVDYGVAVGAPTAVLRFVALKSDSQQRENRNPISRLRQRLKNSGLPSFDAGDWVGILAPGSDLPRFYSLASASTDGQLEICVRQHPDGLCSGFLHTLTEGDTIEAFIQPNPRFRPTANKAPVVLIGAGTGIAPLMGFIRHNQAHHPMHLYWGGRCPTTDFLYQTELNDYLKDKRLTTLNTAFSRVSERAYVQDKMAVDGEKLRQLIETGGQVLVCGGRSMANSVITTLNEIIAPLNIDVQTLKAEGRYREDVY